ncbi:MAG: glucosidase, partial [Candidatus Limnocylindrales bacterium]
VRVKAFSIVGLIPLFAARVLDPELLEALPAFASHLEQLASEHPTFFGDCTCFAARMPSGRRLLAIVDEHRLLPILDRLLDEDRFWSPFGVRSVSRRHSRRDLPVDVVLDGVTSRVEYEPGETATRIKGGNSNWRGPVWLEVNYLLRYSLRQYARYYGDSIRHAYPAPDGPDRNLHEIADDLARRVIALYVPGPDGIRPAMGADPRWRDHPAFRDRLLFYEYFHGESGVGLGASHQTGWTALLANLIDELHRPQAGPGR